MTKNTNENQQSTMAALIDNRSRRMKFFRTAKRLVDGFMASLRGWYFT
jgi:hypothetical protein